MISSQLNSNLSIFFCTLWGLVMIRRSVLDVLICLELLLLSVNLNFLVLSIYLDDCYGQVFSLFILTIAAAEASVGLALLILLYRMKGTISISQKNLVKG